MESPNGVEFKTLLSKDEYDSLLNLFKGNRFDYQTNHYFDTSRFSLKAADASLRVRERDGFELTLKKKKGYSIQEFKLNITKELFEEIKNSGVLPESPLQQEISLLIGNQKLTNFMSLSTNRLFFTHNNGVIFIDESHYLGITDYELEYEAKNFHDGKKEFIKILTEFGIRYKKSERKIKRAYNALKRVI